MSPVFAKQSDANKVAVTAGQTLADVIGGASLEDVGLYNWGTKDHEEIKRALVELVGCEYFDSVDPLQSELDPALGTGGAIHLPVPWKADGPLDAGKTHTLRLKKRLPMTAVSLTALTTWFDPATATCEIGYKLEGAAGRADKTDVEVHVARYRDRQGVSQSSYYEVRDKTPRDSTKAAGPDNPLERNEVPSGTDGDGDTYIWREHRDGLGPSLEVGLSWDGMSMATKGVLAPADGGPKYIDSTCAPYSVLVRYYKSDDDKAAAIVFAESFYPRWTVGHNGAWTLDEASLVVRWIVTNGKTPKLKHGQLWVLDRNNTRVCRVALDEAMIAAGELDLAPLWPAAHIERPAMPYRVQIQVHSGPDEDEGLALALSPTQVRAPGYQAVQFVAFNVRPGGRYMGSADHDADIKLRCDAMIEAIQLALPLGNADERVLKVFMAPEFYFRGLEGAYPIEKIETIVPRLRAETDKIDYVNWMFVFGTAIGYQKHEDAGRRLVHEAPQHHCELTGATPTSAVMKPLPPATEVPIPLVGWRIEKDFESAEITGVTEVVAWQEYVLTFAPGPTFEDGPAFLEVPTLQLVELDPPQGAPASRICVKGDVASRIPSAAVATRRWEVTQGTTRAWIDKSTPVPNPLDEFWLELSAPAAFVIGAPIELVEPIMTEVTNVALVQKGYPTPYMGDGGLRHVAIYKEKISPIDFANAATDWHAADASQRKITIHNTPDRAVLPTAGAEDLGGASPNLTGSEINKSGIGGGVVFTMDDVTFGLEVCLDHGKNRLANFYAGPAKAGDPKVQVHLIPSWGMSIGAGAICCPPDGAVFNVDGQRCDSVARLYDGTWGCDAHPDQTGPNGGVCTVDTLGFYCAQCGTEAGDGPGNCSIHTATPLSAKKKCGAYKYFGCAEGCWATPAPCAHLSCRPFYQCSNCRAGGLVGNPLACCANPNPVSFLCGKLYSGPKCTCGKSDSRCNRLFQPLGEPIAPVGFEIVPSSRTPIGLSYFQRGGHVMSYPFVLLVPPDIV